MGAREVVLILGALTAAFLIVAARMESRAAKMLAEPVFWLTCWGISWAYLVPHAFGFWEMIFVGLFPVAGFAQAIGRRIWAHHGRSFDGRQRSKKHRSG